jgi:hypothetical protein
MPATNSGNSPDFPASLLPRPDQSELVDAPPGAGPGYWAGAPSVVMVEDGVYIAYRLRRPLGAGRGYAVKVARSADGVRFETILTLTREQFAAESLERPALVRSPAGRWRLYVSCATPGTKHWRVEMLDAVHPSCMGRARRSTAAPPQALVLQARAAPGHLGDRHPPQRARRSPVNARAPAGPRALLCVR